MKDTEKAYPYKDVPLTSATIQFILRSLYNGQLLHRQVIIQEVAKYHENCGGIKANAHDISTSFKKALNIMKAKGLAQNPTFGYWRI